MDSEPLGISMIVHATCIVLLLCFTVLTASVAAEWLEHFRLKQLRTPRKPNSRWWK